MLCTAWNRIYCLWVSRFFHSLWADAQHSNRKYLYFSFWLKHTGSSFIICTDTTLIITISAFTLEGRKASRIFTFIMCPDCSCPVLLSFVPLALPQTSFLLHTELHTPKSQNLQQRICPHEVPGTTAIKQHFLFFLYSQKQNITWFWITGMKVNSYTC